MRILSAIALCLFVSFLRCKKENGPTFINIKIIDKKSQKPIRDVSVEIAFTYIGVKQGSQTEQVKTSFYKSDLNGEIKNIAINDSDYSVCAKRHN